MLLYTWKDVERQIIRNKDKWGSVIFDVEVYADEIIVCVNEKKTQKEAVLILDEILDKKYDNIRQMVLLDLKDEFLNVVFESGEAREKISAATPLFRNVLYQKSAYYSELIEKELPGVPVIAFHSYKGGVGRTLSLLAFAKAWSSLNDVKNSRRLLIVDADIEAPGITWLVMEQEEASFSFLDLLEVIQEKDSIEEAIDLVLDKIPEMTIKIETEKMITEHIVIPVYRYIEQLMDMYASPQSLAASYQKKYVLAEVLSKLGEKVNAEMVLIDLRAGLSEFSAPLLFDPRVKKYLVTSTSYQSVKGTKILLQQLSKGLPFKETSKIPEIFLTMGQADLDTADIISEFAAVYDQYVEDENISVTDDIVTELPFASELVHLESLSKIMQNLNGRDFYKNISQIVQNSYISVSEVQKEEYKAQRDRIIRCIHDFAANQITAEGNGAFEVLLTDSIQNLVKKYKNKVPAVVIMGAKGSGKTFLYREILRNQYWEDFIRRMNKNSMGPGSISQNKCILAVPLLASGNAAGFSEIIESAISGYNQCGMDRKIKKSVCIDSKDALLEYKREEHDILEWKGLWKKIILHAFQDAYPALETLEDELGCRNVRAVFLIDGLEEIFQHTMSSENERNAVAALCRDFMDEVKMLYDNFGLMVFLRKDMARDSFTVNFEQFFSQYRQTELRWSGTEALRLAVWLVSQAVPDFYQEDAAIEMAPKEVVEQALHKLWGIKLGKPASNEANSSRWILAALSDFNGQLQARDIIRFLEKATSHAGKPVYPDRYLMPAEIKKAISECSAGKIDEIRDEIKALGPIFDKLEHAPSDNKVLPFSADTFHLTQAEEKILKQEGYLKIDNERYYLPEIIRHALKFKYGKGARPKVLSLLLK